MAEKRRSKHPVFTSSLKDIASAVDAFLSYCQAKNLSSNSVIYYVSRLQSFSRFVDRNYPKLAPGEITAQIIRAFIVDETQAKSASTAAHGYITLRIFFNFLHRDGYIPENPMLRVDKPKTRKTVINAFTLEQVEAVMSTCGRDFVGLGLSGILFPKGTNVSGTRFPRHLRYPSLSLVCLAPRSPA